MLLSAAVRVLENVVKTEPTFDHERLDVDRLSIDYAAVSNRIAKTPSGINRHARDHWLRAAQSSPLNIAEKKGKRSLKDKNRFFEIARGSALKCASIHDILRVCDAFDPESASLGKSNLKRIVSMLTRLIQRTQSVSEGSIEYEYEYRDAEYEYENTKSLACPALADNLTMNISRFGDDKWLPEHLTNIVSIRFCGDGEERPSAGE